MWEQDGQTWALLSRSSLSGLLAGASISINIRSGWVRAPWKPRCEWPPRASDGHRLPGDGGVQSVVDGWGNQREKKLVSLSIHYLVRKVYKITHILLCL